MKHSVTYLFVLMLVLACKPTVPSEYIQPDEMEDILYDYHIAQAMSRTSVGSEADLNKQVYLDAVLKNMVSARLTLTHPWSITIPVQIALRRFIHMSAND